MLWKAVFDLLVLSFFYLYSFILSHLSLCEQILDKKWPSACVERPLPVSILLHIEVNAVGDSNEHKTGSNAIALGHAHPDAVVGRVGHGLEMTREVALVVQGVLGGVHQGLVDRQL